MCVCLNITSRYSLFFLCATSAVNGRCGFRVCVCVCTFISRRDLRLSEITHISELGDTVFLVKRATDAIIFRDDDAKETNYEFS